jgi:hypothetical protein
MTFQQAIGKYKEQIAPFQLKISAQYMQSLGSQQGTIPKLILLTL